MKIVIDSNILISALIKNSVTRKIIMESGLRFYYPALAIQEVEKYKDLILEKSRLSNRDYNELLGVLLSYIILVPQEVIVPFIQEANKIMGNIDKKDVIFIAFALAVLNEGIWSEDGDFRKQDNVRVWNTREILELIKTD